MKNITLTFTCILIFFNAFFTGLAAQSPDSSGQNTLDLDNYIQEKYGLDQYLVNGVQYYNKYHRVHGSPFLKEDFQPGAVTLSGIRYDQVRLNYDIYNQYLILEYTGQGKGKNRLIIPPVHTQAFQLGDSYFEKLSPDRGEPLFYQIIRVDSLSFLIHYSKLLINNTNDLKNTGYFTESQKLYFFDYKGNVMSIKNRKSLIDLFPETYKKEIRKYMRVRMVSFRKATPGELRDLLNFLSLLESKRSES